MNDRPIHVSKHAVARYRARFNVKKKDASDEVIADCLRQIFTDARETNRLMRRKSKAFTLYQSKRVDLPEGQVFALSNDGRVAVIVAVEEDSDTVLTTLSRAASVAGVAA